MQPHLSVASRHPSRRGPEAGGLAACRLAHREHRRGTTIAPRRQQQLAAGCIAVAAEQVVKCCRRLGGGVAAVARRRGRHSSGEWLAGVLDVGERALAACRSSMSKGF